MSRYNKLLKNYFRPFSVIPAPDQVEGRLRRESRLFKMLLGPRFHGDDELCFKR
jgi:hypothetical protein